jgi:hypothetical protein
MSINNLSLPPPDAESSNVSDILDVPESQYIVNKDTLRNLVMRLSGHECAKCEYSLVSIFRSSNVRRCTNEQIEACTNRTYGIEDLHLFNDI